MNSDFIDSFVRGMRDLILFVVLCFAGLNNVVGNNSFPRVLFVAGKGKIDMPSFRMRGFDMASHLGAATASCGRGIDTRKYDIYVHVKQICHHLFAVKGGRHIYDVIDSDIASRTNAQFVPKFDALILGTDADIAKNCHARVCARIPHHVNLPCSPRAANWPLHRSSSGRIVLGIVGSADYKYVEKYLSNFSAHGIQVVTEGSNVCVFYASISIGLVWDPQPKESVHKDRSIRKPPTRLANTAFMNIPTISTSTFIAYHRYEHADKFLCSGIDCILERALKIMSGELVNEFNALRDSVAADTSLNCTLDRYRNVFADVLMT